MFIFGKKRRNFRPDMSRRHLNYRKDSRGERSLKHKLASVKKLFIRLVVFSIFAGIVYLFLFSSFFTVKEIDVAGNQSVRSEDIKILTGEIIDQKVLKIFPNTLFWVKTSDIESKIKENFASIREIKVTKRFPGRLEVSVIEKPIDISWCNRITVEKVSQPAAKDAKAANPEVLPLETFQCYFSDESNTIYKKVDDEPSNTAVKVFKDAQISLGIKVADEPVKKFIREISAKFNSKTGLSLAYLYMPPVESRELDLATSDGWKIYFDLTRGVDGQLDVLNSTLKNLISEDDKKKLDYINLTVIDRVYFKTR